MTELARTEPLEAISLPRGSWWQDVDTPEDLRRGATSLRRSLTKPVDGPVSRYLNRPISTRMSMTLAHLPIHPDVVSLIAFLMALAGAWALGAGLGIVGALIVHASSVLDGVDGEIARLRLRASPAGALLDGVLDRLADAAIIAGITVWALALNADPALAAVLAVAATTGAMLSMAAKDRIAALGISPLPERWIGWLMGGRDARLLIVSICGVFGVPLVALAAIAATSASSLAVRLILARAATRGAWASPR